MFARRAAQARSSTGLRVVSVELRELVGAAVPWAEREVPPGYPEAVAHRDFPARAVGPRKPTQAVPQPKGISSVISPRSTIQLVRAISLRCKPPAYLPSATRCTV